MYAMVFYSNSVDAVIIGSKKLLFILSMPCRSFIDKFSFIGISLPG
jgi:hypothetical protein